MKIRESEAVASVSFHRSIRKHEFPENLRSDQGANFKRRLALNHVKLSGIQRHITARRHPQGNVQVNRTHRTLIMYSELSLKVSSYGFAIYACFGISLRVGRPSQFCYSACLPTVNWEYQWIFFCQTLKRWITMLQSV